MPPIQLIKQRQKLIDSGSSFSPDRTVAQVVVMPLTASKYACVKDSPGISIMSGTAPKSGVTAHTMVASRKPSRGSRSRLWRRETARARKPQATHSANAAAKPMAAPSS